jgi:hypothetical protein
MPKRTCFDGLLGIYLRAAQNRSQFSLSKKGAGGLKIPPEMAAGGTKWTIFWKEGSRLQKRGRDNPFPFLGCQNLNEPGAVMEFWLPPLFSLPERRGSSEPFQALEPSLPAHQPGPRGLEPEEVGLALPSFRSL